MEQGELWGLGAGTLPRLTLSLSYLFPAGTLGTVAGQSGKVEQVHFLLNILKFLVCFMVFPCVKNIFPRNLDIKMSTRISSTLRTGNLIFSFF